MARPSEYKPLLFTTTMRNPERLKFLLFPLSKFKGQILDDNLTTIIVGETIRYGLYRPTKRIPQSVKEKWKTTPKGTFANSILTDDEVKIVLENNDSTKWDDIKGHKEAGFDWGFPSRFATIYDLTKELGLAYYAPQEPIVISELGEHLLKSIEVNISGEEIVCNIVHPEYEQQVFLQAMAKSQRKNPFVRVLNDNIPLILLLQTIKLLNADERQNGAGISRRELPLLIFWKDNDANALYNRIVKLRKQFGYNPSDEAVIDICVNEIMNGNFKKFDPKSIMVDYTDEFIRKMRITGLISLRGAGRFVDINKNELEKVEYVINQYANYTHFSDEKAYFNHVAKLDKNLIKIKAKQVSATNAEKLLTKWLTQYAWEKIKKELAILSSNGMSKDDVLKFIAAPSRLEFLTALAIKSKMPDVRVMPNYSCDDEGLPTSTAGGNKGDIECFEQQNGILVEVTMATGRQQTMMEIWPIERHLADFQKEIKAQCVFVAPSIYNDSVRQIQFISFETKGEKKIRPYTIKEFVDYLEKTRYLYEGDNYETEFSGINYIAAEPTAPYGMN